jgi:uncharacterized protein with HEPN domain
MSKREYELFLFDIVISILKIKYVISKFDNASELKYDFIHWDSVIREYEIIGEATNKLIKVDILSIEQRSIVNFRNILIHEYFGISEEEIWDISTNFIDDYLEIISNKINKNSKLFDGIIEENKHLDFISNYLQRLKDV